MNLSRLPLSFERTATGAVCFGCALVLSVAVGCAGPTSSSPTLIELAAAAPSQPAVAACTSAAAGGPWVSTPMPSQSGQFEVSFDATPSTAPTDVVIGLSEGAATSFSGLAAIARFNAQGHIDARNGGAYTALSPIPYLANQRYHFRLAVSLLAHTYSVWVTPAGGAETAVGLNYGFRTGQSTRIALNHWAAFVDSKASAAVAVCGFAVAAPAPPVVQNPGPTGAHPSNQVAGGGTGCPVVPSLWS